MVDEGRSGDGDTGMIPGAAPVVEAVQRVFRDGLLTGVSSFAPSLVVWNRETASDLRARFVDRPDTSSDPFLVKLRRQLDGAPNETIVLAAELLYVNLVPLKREQIGIPKKQSILTEILSWAQRKVEVPEHLNAALTGFLLGGQAFLNYRWAQFQFLVLLVERLTDLPPAERQAILEDPWAFRDECLRVRDGMGNNMARSQIHVLQSLLFPDTFLPIASGQSKQQILAAYRDRLPRVTGDEDRDLLALRDLLQRESDRPVNFFAEPWVSQWRPTAQAEDGQRGWLVRGANVGGHNFIPDWLARGYCSMSWKEVPEIPAGASKAAIQEAVSRGMPDSSAIARGQAVAQLHSFLTLMRPGDVVVTVAQDDVHVGTVGGPAVYAPQEGLDRARRRPVTWATVDRPLRRDQLSEQARSKLQGQMTIYDISAVAAELATAAGLEGAVKEDLRDADATGTAEPAPVTGELADKLLMPLDWLRQTARQLEHTRQMILYGPPGTGKTYLAQRLAAHMAGEDRVRLVQFHPSYTYEDFFEGLRPVRGEGGAVTFEVVPGPFKLLVERARQDPANPYVLIIDEINRANVAKVFGELYFLLEYRNKPITTQYSPEQEFDLPENVYVIGTMNTADRSITLIDAALRRRFVFRRLSPDQPPVAGLLRRWLAREGLPDHPARLLDELNARLPDPDRAIGPSYLMNRSVADHDGLELVWSTQILPLLEDQFHGTGVDVEQEYGLETLRAAASMADPGDAP